MKIFIKWKDGKTEILDGDSMSDSEFEVLMLYNWSSIEILLVINKEDKK